MRDPSLIALSHDHHHGLALALRCRKQALGQIKPMGAEGLRMRAEEFRDFHGRNLVPHFRAEEEVLFPFVQALIPESEPMIAQLVAEHRTLGAALARLESEAGLSQALFEIGDLLERHIRKEERELFPLYEKHVRPDDADTLGKQIQKVLGRAPSI